MELYENNMTTQYHRILYPKVIHIWTTLKMVSGCQYPSHWHPKIWIQNQYLSFLNVLHIISTFPDMLLRMQPNSIERIIIQLTPSENYGCDTNTGCFLIFSLISFLSSFILHPQNYRDSVWTEKGWKIKCQKTDINVEFIVCGVSKNSRYTLMQGRNIDTGRKICKNN